MNEGECGCDGYQMERRVKDENLRENGLILREIREDEGLKFWVRSEKNRRADKRGANKNRGEGEIISLERTVEW